MRFDLRGNAALTIESDPTVFSVHKLPVYFWGYVEARWTCVACHPSNPFVSTKVSESGNRSKNGYATRLNLLTLGRKSFFDLEDTQVQNNWRKRSTTELNRPASQADRHTSHS